MVANMASSLSLYLFLSSFLLFQLVIAEQNGFGFKIIHRDSPESPLYPGNLTLKQRLQRFHNQTNDYISHVASVLEHNLLNRSENTEPTWIRPPVSFKYPYYITIIGIGTFTDPGIPYKNMYVMIDTGSDLIWTQCENCRDCFPQNNPLYPYTRSSTYQNLPCNRHPLCYPGKCEGNKCSYIRNYAGNAVSQGYVSRERFTFNADNGATEVVTLVFGCGFDQKQFNFGQNNPITGILGLGNGPRGLLNQLGPIRSLGRMSYCIPHYRDNPAASSTFLRFGADAQFKPDAQLLTTQLIQGPVYQSFYYVDLLP
ncbi:hypothetical protein IFM89_034851 [Coptis chinensis]|uniref:Peptidase A1 domain-containing protein n=1 Tax=Coptis chinensis TaxID=261450 RepID=A0A835I9A4_9MAGN|nr:hypothetical protein IFM89_034851 [Coptis chinensis]